MVASDKNVFIVFRKTALFFTSSGKKSQFWNGVLDKTKKKCELPPLDRAQNLYLI